MKTFAAVLEKLHEPLVLRELDIMPLRPGQVLVELAYSGLCRSQLNEIQGFKGEDRFLPHTLGHEGSGIVLDVGAQVTKVKPGDPVVLSWIRGQGLDVPSCYYDSLQGRVNSGAISTFLTRAVISENRLIPIPKAMPLREAALLGCAVPTGAGVIFNQMQIQPGQSLAIFGLGGIGMSALLAARHAQAYPLIAVDVHPDKLETARQLGATHLVNARTSSPPQAIRDWTQGQGVEFAFECVGKKEVMEWAFQGLHPQKGLAVIAGNLPRGQTIAIDPFDLILGKRIVGTWGGSSQIERDVQLYTSLFLEQKIPFQSLITHEEPLENVQVLLDALEAGQIGRGMLHHARPETATLNSRAALSSSPQRACPLETPMN